MLKEENLRLIKIALKLAPIIYRYRRVRRKLLKGKDREIDYEKVRKEASKAVKTFIELGPSFIKLGQLLSARPDILPQAYLDEFSKLQDEVPADDFSKVKPIIEEDLGKIEDIFESFNEDAIAGASLAQVYRAKLKGKDVVVKVNRPNIRETVERDIRVMKRALPLLKRFLDPSILFSLESVLDQFSETIFEEMDYLKEASNLERIRAFLRDKDVIIPKVYHEYTTKRVIIMEYIKGIKITDLESLKNLGLDPRELAVKVDKLFLKMLLTQDIFHADPHPGNISVTEDNKIILYDFGMVGSLDATTRLRLVRLYLALTEKNPSQVVNMLLELEALQPDANRFVIEKGVELAIRSMYGKKVEEMEVKALMQIANRTIYQFPFKLPKHLVLYMRMSTILEGLCLTLDPKFQFIKVLQTLLEEEGLVREAYMEEIKQSFNKFTKALSSSIEVFPMLKSFLEVSQISNVKRGSNPSTDPLLIGSIISASSLIASALIYTQSPLLSQIGLFISILSFMVGFKRRKKA
ncbi:MAG: AarF/ABC1/UbiB kinase family protein [Nitrososphaerales archaeon]